MHVLLISHYFWPESFRINQVVEDLIAAGAEVTVLAGHPNYPEGRVWPGYSAWRTKRERHPAGYEILRVPIVSRGAGGAVRLALNYLSFTASAIVFGTWLLRDRRFDVVFVYCTTPAIQGYAGLWLGRIKRAPVVQWVQDLWPQALSATGFVKSRAVLGLVGRGVNWMYRRSDLILGQSRAFVRHLQPQAGGTEVQFFPNPGEHPASAEAASSAEILPVGFNVMFGGNLGTFQAVGTIVEAAVLLHDDPEIRITLVGSGSMKDWIAAECAARRLTNLVLAGHRPPAAMPGLYAQADALLLTLIDDPLIAQTVPSKLQSYLGSGRPVIAAVNGEAADIVVEAGAGIACAAEDPAALAAAIRALKEKPAAERRAMGEAACRFFDEHYKPEPLARTLLDGLERLKAGRPFSSKGEGEVG